MSTTGPYKACTHMYLININFIIPLAGGRIFGTIAVVVDLGFGGVDKFSRLPFRNHCEK